MKQSEVATVNVFVSYRGTGNMIRQRQVIMDVTKDDDNIYKATPKLSLDERRLADVPDELQFEIKNGKGFSKRGIKDGNADLINDIVNQLLEQKAL